MKINYLILFLCLSFNLSAQTTSHPFWTPTSDVYDLEMDTTSNLLYIGGNFTKFTPPTEPNGSLVNLQTGMPNYEFANPNSNVMCAVSDGNGGFFIGGNFTQVGDSLRKFVAHIDATGSVTSWDAHMEGNPPSIVRSMTLVGDSLFIGGSFGQIAGETRYCFAALSASDASLYNWAPGFSGSIYSIVAKNNGLYVGGTFTHFTGSNTYNNLVRFDLPSGTASIWQPDITGYVTDIEIIDSTVYISGPIFTVNGQSRSGFASIYEMRDSFGTIVGDSLSDVEISTDGNIYDLLIKGDSLFIVGQFNQVDSQPRNSFAVANRHDGSLYPWSADVSGDVERISLKDSIIYFGGNFSHIDGIERQGLAAYNLESDQLTDWNPSILSGTIRSIEIAGSTVYIGGSFYSIGTKYRSYLASIDHATGIPTNWNPQINGLVNAVHLTTDKILIGGEFTTVNGVPRNHFASFDRATGNLLSWNPSVNGAVYSIGSLDSMIFVGGAFTQVNGTSFGNLVAINETTGSVQSWNPQLNDTVHTVYISNGYLYAGGDFTSSGASSRMRIARFNLGSLTLDSWNPEFNGKVRAVSQNGNEILVGGDFTTVNSTNRNYFASIQVVTGNLNSLDVNPNDYVRSIETFGTKSYLGGRFTTIDGQQRNYVAELDLFNDVISPWNLNPTGPYGPTAVLCIFDSTLVVAGSDFGPAQGATGHIYEVLDFASFTPLPFTVNVFTHPSFYNTCSGSALIETTGAPGFTFVVDNDAPRYSNGSITIDSLCAGIHNLKVYDFYNDSIIQLFVIGQDSGIFVLDTLSNSGLYSLFGITIENCNIDYQTIDTMYIVSGAVIGNQLNLVWTVIDSTGTHTDSTLYDLFLGPGMYYVQIGFYCPFKSQDDFYSYTQLVYIADGDGTASVVSLTPSVFEIYPNPTNDQVHINFSGSDAELTVYDAQGKMVLKDQIQNQEIISLQNFERGVYLFDFKNSQGHSVQRVVKQ
ncbi:T9SS type A sorting domain-containing protein [uncultured Fluviicola sp.]|uniref:T9SS type A sorting domain-containing protein n=1 Tax=uncultured Fluviicola sp. TaxID=463303 RepID=UPI0025F5CE5A|nr:T9SS type A sorting domain-containing protein [uncultured Fluviicola sp.]